MNDQDYLAACDRLQRVATGKNRHESLLAVYHNSWGNYVNDGWKKDKLTVYDAEHDDTPATVEWLREVLGTPIEEYCDEITSEHCTLWLDDDGSLESIGFECSMFANPTRGDVLTLLRVFQKEARQ